MKNEVYTCPYKCGDKRYPARKWKTENGFNKHLNECYMRPEAVQDRLHIKQKNDDIERNRKLEFAENNTPKYNIGDIVYYAERVVTKNTHKLRGNRMVKVRYEEEGYLRCRKIEIISIDFLKYGAKVYNNLLYERELYVNKDEYENRVVESTKAWLESNKTASDYR